MKKHSIAAKTLSLALGVALLFSSCASTTLIQSTPMGAKVYINDEPVGVTPYYHTDTKIVGSVSTVRLEKEGYKPVVTLITRDEKLDAGALVGGLFVGIPFLWILEYKPTHNYELKPAQKSPESMPLNSTDNSTNQEPE